MYDYTMDYFATHCLDLAKRSKSKIGFGAVLVNQDGLIMGVGWNRRATPEDRQTLPYVDYAIHAEQASIIDALSVGYKSIDGCSIYVLGMVLTGANKGTLTTRSNVEFICTKCPHALMQYNLSVYIPHVDGWRRMTAEEAVISGEKHRGRGTWSAFAKGVSL